MESSMRLRPKTHDFPNEHLRWKVWNEIAHLMAADTKGLNLSKVINNNFFEVSGDETCSK